MNPPGDHGAAYKQALKNQDESGLRTAKAWLTADAAAVLLNQDPDGIERMLAYCADLAPLADHYDRTGKPGDYWRALSAVLTAARHSGKPLQQLRLALPSSVSGLLLKHIDGEAGITSKTLAERCKKTPQHISNEIKKLEAAGLICRKIHGREHPLFLTALGKTTLDATRPLQPLPMPERKPAGVFPHADQQRVDLLEQRGAVLPFSVSR